MTRDFGWFKKGNHQDGTISVSSVYPEPQNYANSIYEYSYCRDIAKI